MEMLQNVKVRANDTELFFKVKIGNHKSFISAAMFKVAVLYVLAKRKNVYAYIYLFRIYHDIEKMLHKVTHEMEKLKESIKKQLGSLPDVTFPIKFIKQFGFDNPIHFGLIRLFQAFDDCLMWLYVARSSQCFSSQSEFSALKSKIKSEVFNEFSKIISINTRDFPRVNFNDYFEKSLVYQQANEAHGAIDPQFLYSAISSAITPILPIGEKDKIIALLRKS